MKLEQTAWHGLTVVVVVLVPVVFVDVVLVVARHCGQETQNDCPQAEAQPPPNVEQRAGKHMPVVVVRIVVDVFVLSLVVVRVVVVRVVVILLAQNA